MSSRSFMSLSLYQKVFIVKHFYKLGEDVDSVLHAFQREFSKGMHSEIYNLISQIIHTFESTGSIANDFYYRKIAVSKTKQEDEDGEEDDKGEIMYLPVCDVQEETIIETDPDIYIQEHLSITATDGPEDEAVDAKEAEIIEDCTTEDDAEPVVGEHEDEEEGEVEMTGNTASSNETTESESETADSGSDTEFKVRTPGRRETGGGRRQQEQNTPMNQQQRTKRKPNGNSKSPNQRFCEICNKYIRSCYSEHMSTHSNVREYECKVCLKAFTTVRYLKEHLMTHAEGKFVCGICGKASKTKSNHNSHMKVHGAEKKFQCSVCEMKFLRPQGLKRHMLTHTGEKPFKCRHCTQEFALFMTWQMHERLHTGERPYKCHLCEKAFIGAPALNVS